MNSSNHTSCDLAFYNLVANILFNNQLHEENIAVRNVWKKGSGNFLNVYFYATHKSKVLDANYIHDIYDLSTEKYYKDINLFIKDFFAVQDAKKEQKRETRAEKTEKNYNFLEKHRSEILILSFFSRLNPNLPAVKENVIREFIKNNLPKSASFSDQYIDAYIRSLFPRVNDFYEALDNLGGCTPEQVENLAKEAVKISAADGVIHYEEKIFLAELFQTLREHGIEVDIEL